MLTTLCHNYCIYGEQFHPLTFSLCFALSVILHSKCAINTFLNFLRKMLEVISDDIEFLFFEKAISFLIHILKMKMRDL